MKFNKPKIFLLVSLLLASFLRLYKLDVNPPSLFGDELDVGYQAYSILKTGRDYYGNFIPLHFHSLADIRTPFYLYSSVPTVALFGITPWGVRLPAAVFGIVGVFLLYALVKLVTKNEKLALFSAFLLAISPWDIQYSRAAYEVTELLAAYIGGLYFFIRGLKEPKFLTLGGLFLGLTPWIYNTAKLFLPLTILAIIVIWSKELLRIPKKHLYLPLGVFLIVIIPFALSTLFGGGVERFNYLSIVSDPTIQGTIGFDRERDMQAGFSYEKLFHNTETQVTGKFLNNYVEAFSTDFLFIKGDPNIRQSLERMGEFYKFELPLLILGIIALLKIPFENKFKKFLIFWIIAGAIPSALTIDGGTHATRLILLLIPLTIVIAAGATEVLEFSKKYFPKLSLSLFWTIIVASILFYQHDYWIHYPVESQKLWDSGYKDAVKSAASLSSQYGKIVFSDADEPSLIYFLGWSQFPPDVFQRNPLLTKTSISGIGDVLELNTYYFTPQGSQNDLYTLGTKLPPDTLYIAPFSEIKFDLIKEPQRVPSNLKVIKTVFYPSGDPAFYLFAKK